MLAREPHAATDELSADTPASSTLEEDVAFWLVPESVMEAAAPQAMSETLADPAPEAPADRAPEAPAVAAPEAPAVPAPEAPSDPGPEVKDVIKPTTTLVSPTTAGPFNTKDLSIRVEASDNVGLARITANIYAGSTLVKSTTSPMGGQTSGTHVATVTLLSGTYTIRYNSLDTAGNVSATRTQDVVIDNDAPKVSVKPESVSSNGRYRVVSFKLEDAAAGQIDKVLINGVVKDLTNNKWSDVNDVAPGVLGAREGDNTIVVFDTAGNTASMSFVLDTKGPDVTVKPESQGAAGAYRTVSFKLHDEAFVDKVMINGVLKDLSNNAWSDVNGVTPGQTGRSRVRTRSSPTTPSATRRPPRSCSTPPPRRCR